MDSNKLRILVVEDEVSIGSLMEMEFEDLGYSTTVVGLAAEAQRLIQAENPPIDLCIFDLRLPDGDGLSLLQSVKAKIPHVPVILMTGHGNKATVIEALKLGAYDFIEKPFSISGDLFPVLHRAEATIRLQNENVSLSEQILHQSKLAALGELSATVVHDIRGPLSAIQVVCEDLMDEAGESGPLSKEALSDHLKHIGKACDRIRNLVDHLRAYSRQDVKEVVETRSLELLIDDSLYLVQQKTRKFAIKVEKHVAVDLVGVGVRCLPNKFEQVVMNLCSNACDAMQGVERRVLRVEVSTDSEHLLVAVKDSGTGMSKEIQSKIFESFFTTKPRGEGTGLGLKIVRNVVREHDGELLLDSTEGVGTTFTIRLPMARVVRKGETQETKPSDPSTGPKAA
jgi:signal transduction histidine kinase